MTHRIRTEIEICRNLDHPHIIKLLDTFTTTARGERPFPFGLPMGIHNMYAGSPKHSCGFQSPCCHLTMTACVRGLRADVDQPPDVWLVFEHMPHSVESVMKTLKPSPEMERCVTAECASWQSCT